eukprot:8709_1
MESKKDTDDVQHSIDRIVFNSYEKAMNLVDLGDSSRNEANICNEIERIKKLLDVDNPQTEDKGAFRKGLVERIQKVLIDKKSGGHTMNRLEAQIKNQLVVILTIIFSNGNSVLYYGQEHQDIRLANLWLKL